MFTSDFVPGIFSRLAAAPPSDVPWFGAARHTTCRVNCGSRNDSSVASNPPCECPTRIARRPPVATSTWRMYADNCSIDSVSGPVARYP